MKDEEKTTGQHIHELVKLRQRIAELEALEAERERAETALRESERKLRSIVEQSVDGIALMDERGVIVEWNPGLEQICGLKQVEALGQPLWRIQFQLLPEEQRTPAKYQQLKAGMLELLETGQASWPSRWLELRIQHTDGTHRYVQVSVFPIKTAEGSMSGAIVRDITDQVQAEEARTRLVAAVEQTEEAIIILNDLGEIRFVNPAFGRITGYAQEELLGQGAQMLESETNNTAFHPEVWRRLARGEAWTGRLTGEKKDGSPYKADVSISPVHDPSGQATEYVIVQRDVTQQVALEAQLRQALKMEAIGQLAGGIAHDFNNLLTAIIGYAALASGSVPDNSLLQSDLREVLKAGEQAASLTRQLLAFSRKQLLQPRVLDLNDVVADTREMLRHLIREDIGLVTVLAPDLGLVKADPGQLRQVIVNLAVNARDAMPQGGTLTLKTANVDLDEAYARQNLDVAAGPYVMLTVSDDGIGMTEQVRSHIFEPFFTTKEEGKGTGLGLATVYGIVRQSEGHIQVDSAPGVGTTFRIYLQRLSEDPNIVAEQGASQVLPRGTEHILVVEDEDAIRTLACRTLERQGYTVLETGWPSEALQLCENAEEQIHLLITDVVMPEMSGGELANRLTTLRPEMKALYMSGYTRDIIASQGVLEEDVILLEKPFTPATLVHTVREVLDALP